MSVTARAGRRLSSAAARRARTLLVLLVVAFGATACNIDWGRIVEAFRSSKSSRSTKKRTWPSPEDEGAPPVVPPEKAPPAGAKADLGVASFPLGTLDPKAIHEWESSASSPKYFSLTYSLSKKASEGFSSKFKAYASSVGYVAGTEHRFRWIPPPGCERDMGCVFQELKDQDRDAVLPIVDLFRKKQAESRLGTLELAQLVVNFVQDIQYVEPDDEPFGMLAPALVLIRSNGDCDSKSLLAHMILAEFGIDSIMLSSIAHRHAMLGIALPVKGTKMIVEGREYAFTELTARGAVIGYLFPKNAKPNDWKPVVLRKPRNAQPSKPKW